MEKLKLLISKCKCSVNISINKHRDYDETIFDYFKHPSRGAYLEHIAPEVYQRMVDANTVIEIQYYPETSIGFYMVYHYDLESAIDEALSTF